MAGSGEAVRPSTTFALRRCGCFAVVLCAAWFVAGTRPAPAGINVWTRHGPPGGDVVALSIDPTTPTTLYAGTDRGGVFKSTDSGGTWSDLGLGPAVGFSELVIDPQTPTTLYAATSYDGVFKSTDSGATWNTFNNHGLDDPYVTVTVLAIAPPALYAGTIWGVYKSTDGGGSWQGTGPPAAAVWNVVIDPTTPRTLYVGTGGGVLKSTDGGGAWPRASTPIELQYNELSDFLELLAGHVRTSNHWRCQLCPLLERSQSS